MAQRVLRYLDLVVLALALPIFIAADLPLIAWGGVTLIWALQRFVQELLTSRAQATGNRRAAMGMMSASLIGRVWLLALVVLAIGLTEDGAGLPAAILTAVVFQVWFTSFMIGRSLEASTR